jgi:adenosylmethionine-8-amino-7-oxononanoate aminotransferase
MQVSERQKRIIERTFLDYRHTVDFLREPLIVNRAEGLSYWDVQGRRYFDGIGGIFAANLGHRHPRIMEAMRRQMERITFAPPLHGISDVTLEYIEKLGSVTPQGLTTVKPLSGGSESVEAALKLTRQYFKQMGKPGKYKVVSRYQGYHGATFGAMAASGTGSRKTSFEPQMAGFFKVWPPTHYRDRFSDWEECNRFSAAMFEDVIVAEDPRTVAAVIVEPVGNTGGIITPTAEYYRLLRDICDRYEVLLIFDEIITGFGRCGAMFAAQAYDVTPDVICSGKAASSGAIPFGNMIARQSLTEAFFGDPAEHLEFAHGHTFGGNPLACAAGISVIDVILENDLLSRSRAIGDRLVGRLAKLKELGVVREVRGMGALRGVELVRDMETMEPFPELGIALRKTALENGLIIRIEPTWFAVGPALIATDDQIDELGDLVEKSLKDALAAVRS